MVVDDEQLEVRDALTEDAVERGAEEALAVADGDEHGDQRSGWTAAWACRSLRRVSQGLPSFDLVVATVGRSDELGRLLDSVEAQGYPNVRVLVVDQNEDGRTSEALADRAVEVVRLSSARGLSRARNVALEHLAADLVAFPDDDCVYPPGLLATVADRLSATSALDGLTGRAAEESRQVVHVLAH